MLTSPSLTKVSTEAMEILKESRSMTGREKCEVISAVPPIERAEEKLLVNTLVRITGWNTLVTNPPFRYALSPKLSSQDQSSVAHSPTSIPGMVAYLNIHIIYS